MKAKPPAAILGRPWCALLPSWSYLSQPLQSKPPGLCPPRPISETLFPLSFSNRIFLTSGDSAQALPPPGSLPCSLSLGSPQTPSMANLKLLEGDETRTHLPVTILSPQSHSGASSHTFTHLGPSWARLRAGIGARFQMTEPKSSGSVTCRRHFRGGGVEERCSTCSWVHKAGKAHTFQS